MRPPHRFYPRLPPKCRWRLLWVPFLLLLSLGGLMECLESRSLHNPNAKRRVITPRGRLATDEQARISLFRQASRSVVHITTLMRRRDIFNLNLFEIPQGSGSGFIWDQDGHIITNYHLIEDTSSSKVTLADQSVWEAQLVGIAPSEDLAVLAIQAPRHLLKPLAIGTSDNLFVGQRVLALGAFNQTLTQGRIFALGYGIRTRTGRIISNRIQTDVIIHLRDGGGPLLDNAGRLIGVNTAIYNHSNHSSGTASAVPVNTVNRIVPHLIRHGRVMRPGLGVRIAHDAILRRLKLSGALILQVVEGGAAEAAGLRGTRRDDNGRLVLGDLIISIEDASVQSVDDLMNALDNHRVGDAIEVTIIRNDMRQIVSVTLEAGELGEVSNSREHVTVRQFQRALQERGYEPGPLDGIWGKQTELAVKRFQKDAGLSVTGKFDSKTQDILGRKAVRAQQLSETPEAKSQQSKIEKPIASIKNPVTGKRTLKTTVVRKTPEGI